jgi:hypothetical protein
MQLLLEFSQFSCKYIYLNNVSEYDLSLGNIIETYILATVPGQTNSVKISLPFSGQVTLNAKNLGIQKNLSAYLQDLTEGYYEFEFVVTQQVDPDAPITESKETFCYVNTCQLDCTIDKKTLDLLQNKCCNEDDCTGKLNQQTQTIETLRLYREGLKSAGSVCKKETAAEIQACIKYLLELEPYDCKCN